MKFKIFFVIFILMGMAAHSGGIGEMSLVNEQNIALENIRNIEILYGAEEISLSKSSSDTIVIREYMNRNNSNYFANVTNSGNVLSVKRGNRPFHLRLFYTFRSRVEILVPEHIMQEITIKTTNGSITILDDFTFSRINLQTTNGSIRCNKIIGNIFAKTTNGGIDLGIIEGDAFVETSNGHITLNQITGSLIAKTSKGAINAEIINGTVSAETTSGTIKFNRVIGELKAETTNGNIYISVAEIVGDISLRSTNGRIELILPQDGVFNFTARTSNGTVSTSFPEKLVIPVADQRLVQGIIGEGTPNNNIDIRSTNGSISVKWRE